MRIIGLTGNIASGKSTVSAALANLGAHIIDADILARRAIAPGTEGEAAIRAAFGEEYFDANGLNRRKLGALVFKDEGARRRLNAITHPIIEQMVAEELARIAAENPESTAVLDAALLLESGWNKRCAEIWLVTAPDDTRAKRITQRDGLTAEEAKQRIAAQMPQCEKIPLADVVLVNDSTPEALIQQAKNAFLKERNKGNAQS